MSAKTNKNTGKIRRIRTSRQFKKAMARLPAIARRAREIFLLLTFALPLVGAPRARKYPGSSIPGGGGGVGGPSALPHAGSPRVRRVADGGSTIPVGGGVMGGQMSAIRCLDVEAARRYGAVRGIDVHP